MMTQSFADDCRMVYLNLLPHLEGGGVIRIRLGDGGGDRAGCGDEAEGEGGEGEEQQHGADAGW